MSRIDTGSWADTDIGIQSLTLTSGTCTGSAAGATHRGFAAVGVVNTVGRITQTWPVFVCI